MKNSLDSIKNFILTCWYSSWAFAIRRVLSQWITSVILILVGIWTVQSLFSFSITSIFDTLPESVRFLINKNISTISKACICGITFVVIFQVLSNNKHYKELFYITELPFNGNKSFEELLKRCELGILYCEGRKETLLLEKDMIKSCSPIPIVAALLGYIVEMVGLANFDWQIYVVFCIFIILIYVFLCIRCIRKFKDNQWKIGIWQKTKKAIEIKIPKD